MTAVTWDHVGKHTATPVSADFAGTFRLLRLYARRDRVVLPLWVLALGLSVGPVYVGSVNDLYSTQQQLDTYAHSIASSPGLIAMYGPMLGTSLGAVSLWKAGFQFTIIAIAAVLTVIRHTRVEEETGRAELVGATRIGRFASLTAALLLTGLGSVLVGLLSFASIASQPVPAAGAAAFGAAMAASGLLWAGVGAVAAQVASTARIARQLALGVLGIAFVLRAVGDVGSGTLSWLSPLGWCQQIRPFAQERWWVLAPLVVAATAATAAAYVLLRGRDVGAGLIADRAGPANASATLAGPVGLAWRLQRGPLLLWTVGLACYGLLFGGAAHGIGDMLGDNNSVRDMLARMSGGAQALEEQFLGYALSMVGLIAAAFSISAALRLHDEESRGHTETVLATAAGRNRLAASHLLFALFGPALAMAAAGLGAGVVYGATTHDMGHAVPALLAGALLQVPAIWVITGITAAIYGFAPRFAPVAWGVFSGLILLYLIGGTLDGFPQWLLDLVPVVHTSKLPGGVFHLAPELWLLGVAAALLTAGVAAFHRRDLR